ncbi:MmcQ/YjbR family DNA-binding protein [Paenibacillus sp. FSL R5-0527]|uniref:YjbR family protein n=1 Tax=Paenibacillus macerans TaxID=44252 RepID=A0A090YIU1_PAEMA|nr:MmcQ/YjbR family DNA-binding protein [Paenibacillus macerans]KFM98404.1 yjbR family protein [Paenibacillus macerans]MCY7560466.1 MmcQ/YjbR family DNA-binding protein [Paenibacillus macerans]MEC0150763.1 MmcQ/YjbR family DNA-binding protein [Paenibacillus macerans]MED4954287.1 MmcQ/YjbR family DNA-binding protein [Paenibacillus macerans]OMG50787.1 MmcQ-like protein [Paenibacillus macerans]
MYNKLTAYCLSKKGAVQEYPFGPDPMVMKVGGKIFALISASENESAVRISLKCDPVIAANLREQHACVQPGYHLNKQHWNTVTADGSLPMDDLQAMIDHSYDLVLNGLTKAAREAVLMRIEGDRAGDI